VGEVAIARGLGGEQQIRDRVGENAVHLFGHRAIERAQAGLDVREAQVHLRGDERTGEGRVDVASDDDDVGAVFHPQVFEGDHDGGGLLGVRA
jgi:hypothetical protein